jgi:spore coat protein U-like protein
MKRTLTTSLLILSALTLGTTSFAADSKNVIINANVVGTCEFVDANDVVINMGDLKANSGDQTKTGTTQFWCSNGVTYTLSTDDGMNSTGVGQKNMLSGANKLPYSLALDKTTGTGTGPAAPIDLTLTATVNGSDLNNAVVANGYTDTVVLTINP